MTTNPTPVIYPDTGQEQDYDRPWQVIVWNDPVNTMSYVVYVFRKLFGYDETKATELMLQVHHEGRAIVSDGPREKAEVDCYRLHGHGLWVRGYYGALMQQRFKAAKGGIDVDLSPDEKVFLLELLEVLAGVPMVGDDPASQRLRVPVYLDDPESNEEWWRLMGEELTGARNADRHVYQRVMDNPGVERLTIDEADAFLRVLNEGRLALGARFGVEVEEDHDRLPEDQRDIFDYLGWLLEELTSQLTRSL